MIRPPDSHPVRDTLGDGPPCAPLGFRSGRWGVVAAVLVVTLYTLCFLADWTDALSVPVRKTVEQPRLWVFGGVRAVCRSVGIPPKTPRFTQAVYLVVMAAAVPWLVMGALGRGRPADIGWRRPNALGWRFCVVGYGVALPFLIWMATGSGVAQFYGPALATQPVALIAFNVVNMFTEHLLFHGILLGALRSGQRWPTVASLVRTDARGLQRVLQWLGLAQETDRARGVRYATRWIGLPDRCVTAIVVSALLFTLVHAGKDGREMALALPGGAALAYLAYRSNSWVVPFVLHLATAGTVAAIILATRA